MTSLLNPPETDKPAPLEIAIGYSAIGWAPIPIPYQAKAPTLDGWQTLRITEANASQYFNGAPQNIGILLGEPSSGLVDVDLDCPEAVTLAPYFLPPTPGRFGRASKRASHWLFFSDIEKTEQYSDPNGGMLVELRSTGGQTVFPPSVHPSGEPIDFEDDADPAAIPTVDRAALSGAVRKLAAATLLARGFPAKGTRHDFCLALGGALLTSGWAIPDVQLFVWAVASAGGSADPAAKAGDVQGTADKIKDGERITEWGAVRKLFRGDGKGSVKKIRGWLDAETKGIKLGADLQRVLNEILAVLPEDADLYQRDARLARVVRVAEAEAARERMAPGTPQIRALGLSTLKVRLTGVTGFTKYDKRSEEWLPASPPDDIVSAVSDWGEYPGVRVIKGIIETPSMRPDGSLITEPGYDATTRYIFAPQRAFPPIPDSPTRDDARDALAVLREPFIDFPWASDEARDVAIAAVLSLVCRPAIKGAVPGIVCDATLIGSGKTLLAQAITACAQGRAAALVTWPDGRDEEVEKILAGYAVRAASVVLWDNVTGVFGGAPLDKVLTAIDRVELRILGRTKVASLAWNAVVLATGNNVTLGHDVTRRLLVARLEPLKENPENRIAFTIPGDLIGWCVENHPRFVAAALTLVRAYVLAGEPEQGTTGWGSFDVWRRRIGDALIWAGGANVMKTRPTLNAAAEDPERSALRTIVELWPKLLPGGGTIRDGLNALYGSALRGTAGTSLVDKIKAVQAKGAEISEDERATLKDVLEGLAPLKRQGDTPSSAVLGKTFRRFYRRPVGDQWLTNAPAGGGTLKWFVCKVGTRQGGEGGEGGDPPAVPPGVSPSPGDRKIPANFAALSSTTPSSPPSPPSEPALAAAMKNASPTWGGQ